MGGYSEQILNRSWRMDSNTDSDIRSHLGRISSGEFTPMPIRNGLKRISDAISRKRDIAAVLVPRRVALELVDEMYPQSYPDGVLHDVLDLVVEKARDKYIQLVVQGGYIGTVMSIPMVVADDVVVCPLSEQELVDSAGRFGVDMNEVYRDRRRAGLPGALKVG